MARKATDRTPAFSVVEAAEEETMKLRTTLITALRRHTEEQGWSREEAAERLDIFPRRISSLIHARPRSFSLVSLIDMVVNAGLRLETRVVK